VVPLAMRARIIVIFAMEVVLLVVFLVRVVITLLLPLPSLLILSRRREGVEKKDMASFFLSFFLSIFRMFNHMASFSFFLRL
jgi:hypothetical protein